MKILLLAGNTLRAKAYIQVLANAKIKDLEVIGLLYGPVDIPNSFPLLNTETENYLTKHSLFIPNYEESIEYTFVKNGWIFSMIADRDVNSSAVLEEINRLDCNLVVFAGYGGQLLKENHFNSKRRYLHMHPGKLPLERGSTTIYYSILNKRKCTVTAFYMSEKIDDGNNILFKEYDIPFKNVDLDQWFDNVVRADCFLNAIKKVIINGKPLANDLAESNEYYVIHPVLKHCAILSLKGN